MQAARIQDPSLLRGPAMRLCARENGLRLAFPLTTDLPFGCGQELVQLFHKLQHFIRVFLCNDTRAKGPEFLILVPVPHKLPPPNGAFRAAPTAFPTLYATARDESGIQASCSRRKKRCDCGQRKATRGCGSWSNRSSPLTRAVKLTLPTSRAAFTSPQNGQITARNDGHDAELMPGTVFSPAYCLE